MKIHWPLTWKETDGDLSRVWVPREHAEAEIGKAIQEEVAKYTTWNREHEEAAYKFERERIADMLEREMNAPDSKDHDAEWNRVTRNALRYAINCIRPKFEASRLVPAQNYREPKPLFTYEDLDRALHPREPKPLEPLMNITVADPNWADVVLAIQNTIESLNQTRAAVNELIAGRMPKP